MSHEEDAARRSLDRREFLKTGSIAAVSLAMPASLLHAAAGKPALAILSVGYADDAPVKEHAGVRLRAAKGLLFGDPHFLGSSARVHIGTFERSPRFADLPGAVDLRIVFPSYGFKPEDYPEVHAWSFRRAGTMQSTSGGVRMTVPVTSTEGFEILLNRKPAGRSRAVSGGTPSAATTTSVKLDTGVGSGVMKLQRGVYVIALREADDEREPDWSSQVLIRNQGRLRLNSSAMFSYLILTMDYAE